MTVTRADIIVLGDVQGVGYRYFVRKVAWKNKISGQVGNLEDGTVKIICEGNENNIKNFLKLIDIKKPPIAVERIDVEFSKASGEFKGFRIVAGALEEEMIEGFSTGASYFEVMFDKQDLLLKITERGFAEVKEEMAKGFGDMRQGFSEVTEEIHLLRDDFRELFMHEVSELRGEIAEIKSTLARMQAAG